LVDTAMQDEEDVEDVTCVILFGGSHPEAISNSAPVQAMLNLAA
jgi:hypothetical protein